MTRTWRSPGNGDGANRIGELGQLMTFRLDGSLKGKTGGAITFECVVR